MATVPQIYEHEQFGQIRVIEIEGEVKFVGRDAAIALGYSNPRDALAKHVPDKFKGVSQIATPYGAQTMTIISEAGLYRLAFRSKLPEAEKFTDWAAEIMVSVRKTGSYTLPESDPRAIFTPTFIRQIADRIESLENQVAELEPKAKYCDLILQSKEALPVTVIAKDYGMGAAEFNNLLHELKIQFKCGKTWVLYQMYVGLGYVKSVTTELKNGLSATTTYWTQNGRMFLYSMLKKANVLPLIERKNPMTPLF